MIISTYCVRLCCKKGKIYTFRRFYTVNRLHICRCVLTRTLYTYTYRHTSVSRRYIIS